MKNISNLLFLSARQRQFCEHLEQARPRLMRMAYSWTHDIDIADEIVQETSIKALKNVDKVKDMKALDGWMFRVLSNCFYDHCRRQHETVDIDDCVLVDHQSPDVISDQDDMLANVRDAISTLPVKHRQVITLVDIESMSYMEVADILQIPIGTVMSRLNRARQKLKETLQDEINAHTGRDSGKPEGGSDIRLVK